MQPVIRFALSIPAVLLASYAIKETVRFAGAEWLSRADTVETLQAALRITPENADYYARIATLDPSRNGDLIHALTLNPRDPSWWIMQSVRQEEDGDVAAAEKSLRQANLVSRYYTPRWSLAAFYYRQGNKAEFIRWAKSALSVGNGQSESLFQMAQRLNLPSSQILDDLLPDVPERVDSYLHLLLEQGKVDQQHAAAARLIRIGSTRNRISILETCESLFKAGRIDQAVDLWNRAIQVRWIALSPLDPLLGESLGDDSFAAESLDLGFDWKNSIPLGVSASRSVTDHSLCLEFSGSQPESCELVSQFVPLLPNRQYRLEVRYRLRSTNLATGLQWSVLPVPSGKPSMAGLMSPSPEKFVEQSFPFETPSQPGPMKMLLSYTRAPGTTRMEGKLWIQSVHLTLLP
jgi:tetratricopeptide (TPR) repeat protein